MKFSVFQLSRRGGRSKNEDRMGYCYTRESVLLLLADGMGGHPEGEVAAELALNTVSAIFQREADPQLDSPADFLVHALMAAHHKLLRYAAEKGIQDTPRTTFVAAVLQQGKVCWIHCGDSRLYVVRNGKLLSRTRDHSYAEHRTLSTAAENEQVNRNILFSCLGSPTRPVFDVTEPMVLHQGDKLLLCSDGLWGSVPDVGIVQQLNKASVHDAVPELVEEALREAGAASDNVTVIALEWETPDAFQPTRGISTDSVLDGFFASTMQSLPEDGMVEDEFDDAAIERSIAEINEAIRKSASERKPSPGKSGLGKFKPPLPPRKP